MRAPANPAPSAMTRPTPWPHRRSATTVPGSERPAATRGCRCLQVVERRPRWSRSSVPRSVDAPGSALVVEYRPRVPLRTRLASGRFRDPATLAHAASRAGAERLRPACESERPYRAQKRQRQAMRRCRRSRRTPRRTPASPCCVPAPDVCWPAQWRRLQQRAFRSPGRAGPGRG